MNTAIISSTKDLASMNIRNSLLNKYPFKETEQILDGNKIHAYENFRLYTIERELIFAENLDKEIDADFFIFVSKHRSADNKPALTVHAIGNWNDAKYGGQEKILCISDGKILKAFFLELSKHENQTITLEATHHGPYIEKPVLFLEIGSTEKEYSDEKLGDIMADVIINAMKSYSSLNVIPALGIGGQHYSTTFNKILQRTDYAIGHICPKFNLEFLDEEMISQAIEKIIPKPEMVILDWKGLGQEKQRIVDLLGKMDIKYERSERII